jgi:hypothetical protein
VQLPEGAPFVVNAEPSLGHGELPMGCESSILRQYRFGGNSRGVGGFLADRPVYFVSGRSLNLSLK